MNLTREQANKWAEALESGNYAQGMCTLFNPNQNTFCCLGVLSLAVLELPLPDLSYGKNNKAYHTLERILDIDTFTNLNDISRKTFPEIAQYIRAMPCVDDPAGG